MGQSNLKNTGENKENSSFKGKNVLALRKQVLLKDTDMSIIWGSFVLSLLSKLDCLYPCQCLDAVIAVTVGLIKVTVTSSHEHMGDPEQSCQILHMRL